MNLRKTVYTSIVTCFLSLASIPLLSQYNVQIFGTVSELKTNRKSKNSQEAEIAIFFIEPNNRIISRRIKANKKGNYDTTLDFDRFYKIVFNSPGYVSKYLTIDLRDIPLAKQEGGFAMNIDISLFKQLEGIDYSLLDQPIGKAKYYAKTGVIVWDMAYTQDMHRKIRNILSPNYKK